MVNTLHEQLRAKIAVLERFCPSERCDMRCKWHTLIDVARAVVELHAPDARWDPPVCSKCVDPVDNDCYQAHPCSTVRAVASALGVETAE